MSWFSVKGAPRLTSVSCASVAFPAILSCHSVLMEISASKLRFMSSSTALLTLASTLL